MKRLIGLAATVWLAIAAFAAGNRAFEVKVLEPAVGPDVAELLGVANLAAFVLLLAVLWLGTREEPLTLMDTVAISATWLGCGLVMAFSMSGRPYLSSWRQAAVFLAASAAAPFAGWALVAFRPHRHAIGASAE